MAMNKSFILFVVTMLLLTICMSVGLTQQQDVQAGKNEGPLFIFDPIKPALRRSGVPALLPAFLPQVDRKHPLPVVLKSAGKSGYNILIATDLPCDGQNNCLYGTLQGSVSPFKREGVPVKLNNGIQAEYIDYECHAYCSEAYVRWKQNGFFYSIGIKGGEKNDLLQIANSVSTYR